MIQLELTTQELQALVALMDAGVKATGLQSVGAAAHLIQKLAAAEKAAQDAQQSNVIDMKDAAHG